MAKHAIIHACSFMSCSCTVFCLGEFANDALATGLQKRPRTDDMEVVEIAARHATAQPDSGNGKGAKHHRLQNGAPEAYTAGPASCPEAEEGDCLVYVRTL